MNSIFEYFMIVFISIFAENLIFSKGMGTNTLHIIARKPKNLLWFSFAVTYISVFAAIVSYFTNKAFSDSEYIIMFEPFIFVLCIGLVYVLTLLVLWKFFYNTFSKVKKFIHLSAYNSAVFGSMFILGETCEEFSEYLLSGVGMGLGFVFAIYIVGIVFDKIYSKEVPFSFRGYPLLMIYIGIISMAFYGIYSNV